MKRMAYGVVVWVAVAIFPVPTAFGSAPLLSPDTGANPTAVLLVEQGMKLYEVAKWQDALFSFEMAIGLDPGLSAPLYNAGLTAMKMGNWPLATSYLEKFLARHPAHSAGMAWLSDIQSQSSRGDAASEGVEPGWGGFAEFGLFGLLGALFIFVLAAYDMGVAHPFGAQKEPEAALRGGAEIFPFCRLRSAPAFHEDEQWIEAA